MNLRFSAFSVLLCSLYPPCFALSPGIRDVQSQDSIVIANNDSVGYVSYDNARSFDSIKTPTLIMQSYILKDGEAVFIHDSGAKLSFLKKGRPVRTEIGSVCKDRNGNPTRQFPIDWKSAFICLVNDNLLATHLVTIVAGVGETKRKALAFPGINEPSADQIEFLDTSHALMLAISTSSHFGSSSLFTTLDGGDTWQLESQLDFRGSQIYGEIRRMNDGQIFMSYGRGSGEFLISYDNGVTFPVKGSFAPYLPSRSIAIQGDYYLLFSEPANASTQMVVAEAWFDPLDLPRLRIIFNQDIKLDGTEFFAARLQKNQVVLITNAGTVNILNIPPLPQTPSSTKTKLNPLLNKSGWSSDILGRKKLLPHEHRITSPLILIPELP